MNSRIEQIIDEIEEYIDGCKVQPLSSGARIIVNKETIDELIAELRQKVPEEVRRYQKIVSNEEAIIANAHAKAEELVEQAKLQNSEMVSEHEIMQQAFVKANEIVQEATNQAQQILDSATEDANNIRMGAIQYTDEMLSNMQRILANTVEDARIKYDGFAKSLNDTYTMIQNNRNELLPPETSQPEYGESGQS